MTKFENKLETLRKEYLKTKGKFELFKTCECRSCNGTGEDTEMRSSSVIDCSYCEGRGFTVVGKKKEILIKSSRIEAEKQRELRENNLKLELLELLVLEANNGEDKD